MNAIDLYRWGRWCAEHRVPVAPRVLYGATFLLFNSSIPPTAQIGPGTRCAYGGIGVVVHKDSKIGRECLLSQQVTIGGRSGIPGAPVDGVVTG